MNTYLSKLARASLYFSLFAIPVTSFASVIAGNLGGSAPGYNVVVGNVVGNDFAADNFAQGVSFTPGANAKVSTVSVALSCAATGFCPDNFTVSLDNNSGGVPGTAIESYTVSGTTLGNLGSANPLVVFTSSSNPTLLAGTEYWLTISTDTNNTGAWNLNQTGDTSATALSSNGGATWGNGGLTPGAYEIDGTLTSSVPEPSSLALVLGCGSLLLFARKFLRR